MAIKKDTAWNIAGTALPAAVGAVSVPYLIAHMGIERFGILTIMWAIVGYASVFDFGLGRSATQQVAARIASGKDNEVRSIASMAIILTAFVGSVVGVIFAISADLLATKILNTSAGLANEAATSLICVAFGIPLATMSNGYRGVLESYRKFFEVNVAKIITGTAIFLLPLSWIFLFGGGLVEASIMLVLARLFGVATFFWLYRALPFNFTQGKEVSFSEKLGIVKSGMWMSASSIVSPVLVYLDRFVIANVMGASFVAYYTMPFEFLIRILIIPGAIGASLLPRFAADYVARPDVAKALFRKSLKLTVFAMAVLCITCGLVAYPLMVNFISVEFADKSIWLILILLFGIFFNGMANIPYTALHAIGAARFTGVLHAIELVCYIPILIILVKGMGLEGAALAWAIRATFDCVIMFARKPL